MRTTTVIAVLLGLIMLVGCGGRIVEVNKEATGVNALPSTLTPGIKLETDGPVTEASLCFASLTVGESPYLDRIVGYQIFTGNGSYEIPAKADGEPVREFNTQGCKDWKVTKGGDD